MSAAASTERPSANLPVPLPTAVLEVIGGVHQGVALPLARNTYTIGSKPSADIMLGDGGIAPEHGVLRFHGNAVVVEAAGGDIEIARKFRLPQGRGCRMSLPVELKIGRAALRIDRPRRASQSWLAGWNTPRVAAVGATCCAALLLASVFATDAALRLPVTDGLGTRSSQDRPADLTLAGGPSTPAISDPATTGTVGASGAASQQAVGAPPPGDANAMLTARLHETGLGDITTTVDGTRIVAAGAIAAEQRGAWSEVQRWFDRTFAGHVVLASAVETRAPVAKPKFDLQAIAFGDKPYVITADGQRRYPGAALDKGWIIKDISAGYLVLTKDGKDFTLNF